jgi:BirA family biotin operon repressor/biotin-[acetyl-CoA-carboxylase] ligase
VTPASVGPIASPPLPDGPAVWDDAVAASGGRWRGVEVVPRTASTNADLLARCEAGEAPGVVLVAEHQTQGRGRLDRTWESPAGTGLTFTASVAPTVDRSAWGWLPLLAGLAVVEAVQERTGLSAGLKWPNDVLVGDRKLGGLLVQVAANAPVAVIGIGINTHLRAEAMPVPEATSLVLEGADAEGADRVRLLTAILGRLAVRMADLDAGPSDQAMADYRNACVTLGRHVDIARTSAAHVRGVVADVADDAALVVDVHGDGTVHVAAGDVTHLR